MSVHSPVDLPCDLAAVGQRECVVFCFLVFSSNRSRFGVLSLAVRSHGQAAATELAHPRDSFWLFRVGWVGHRPGPELGSRCRGPFIARVAWLALARGSTCSPCWPKLGSLNGSPLWASCMAPAWLPAWLLD